MDVVLDVYRERKKRGLGVSCIEEWDGVEIGARSALDSTLFKAMPRAEEPKSKGVPQAFPDLGDTVVSYIRGALGMKPKAYANPWQGMVPHRERWIESDGNGGYHHFHDYEGVLGEARWTELLERLRRYGVEIKEGPGPHSHPDDAVFFMLPIAGEDLEDSVTISRKE